MKSDKWEGIFVDLLPGDILVGGSIVQCLVEDVEPKVRIFCLYDDGK